MRERFPARQPRVALQKAECSWEPQPRAEPARLRVVQQGLADEWVSAQQALRAPALAKWEQFSEPQAQRPEASSDELLLLEPPV